MAGLARTLHQRVHLLIALAPPRVVAAYTTVVGEVQLGSLLCDSLAGAEDASTLQFHIGPDQVWALFELRVSYAIAKAMLMGILQHMTEYLILAVYRPSK